MHVPAGRLRSCLEYSVCRNISAACRHFSFLPPLLRTVRVGKEFLYVDATRQPEQFLGQLLWRQFGESVRPVLGRNCDGHTSRNAADLVRQVIERKGGLLLGSPVPLRGRGDFRMLRAQGGQYYAHGVVHYHRQAESEQRRFRIAERVQFALQNGRQLGERRFDLPT